jgi:BirA family biotin operon repressor/biotin-[acetyl-CoA-carboxylase] ligase
MIILSDNHNSLKLFFGDKVNSFHILKSKNKIIKNIESKFFFEKNINVYESNNLIGWDYLVFTEQSKFSQFDIINELIVQNYELPDNLVCIAVTGENFHGFKNRTWITEKGNIHLTVYFKPGQVNKYFHSGLLLVPSVAVLKTIDLIPDLKGRAKSKWVNDITIDNSKVCGIITQSFSLGNKINGAVVGIGLNVLQKPKFQNDIFTTSAESLNNLSRSENCNLPFVLNQLLKNLSDTFKELNIGNYKVIYDFYCERSAVVGNKVEIYSDHQMGTLQLIANGRVTSINENLELILDNHPSPIKNGRLSIIV